ncbi:RNA polymerase sigma factor [Pseudonocardia sp. N23]|uniref:RNA polymerase sigma factor n=1 Tax=Pseudonocardia sp. N23 TaxID=1987376 RepID=UPI000BFD6B21|nr:sigma-70 family RNA polymerase sigma factor [Pseudonocardia sp. N23]GAY11457.1 RNA polymerase sigma-70 factor, ECF subfamily [Pseudonocardia sp. N23]
MTAPHGAAQLGDLLRSLTPQVVTALARRYGDFETCEDAVQEALVVAATRWPADGVPDNPKAWLIRVAARRRIELWRSDDARRRREEAVATLEPPDPGPAPQADDTRTLMLLCCHPTLTPASQVALTLRAVGGLTTAEIARGFLVPEPTVGQRISRAKQRIVAGGRFRLPPPVELDERVAAVLAVLHLVFNEGYTASEGPDLRRVELSAEAVRLTRLLRSLRPGDDEVAGLLALMLLTDARRDARTGADDGIVPLEEQDRSRWDTVMIAEGLALVAEVLPRGAVGPYQVQGAIAAVHAEAATAADTDWPQILGLYRLLERVAPGPMVALNRVVASAMVDGPVAGLAGLDEIAADPALAGHHRLRAVRAHLLERAGDATAARREYAAAAELTRSEPERRYLEGRAAAL